jgi:hypothetical protein
MRKRLSKKQMFFNKINLTKDDDVYARLGLGTFKLKMISLSNNVYMLEYPI